MNKSELYNDYCEKIEYDELEGGIGYKGFLDRFSKIKIILKFVMNDSLFKVNSCTEEKKFFENVINPILREDKIISKESRDFLFPLIKHSENDIFKYLKKEYCTDKYLKEISCISPNKKEELLVNLNSTYKYQNRADNMILINKTKQIHEMGEDQFYKKYILDNNILIDFIEDFKSVIFTRDEDFNKKIIYNLNKDFIDKTIYKKNKDVSDEIIDNHYDFFSDEIIDNQYEVDVNLSYKMTLITYYRLCTCVEEKRDGINEFFLDLLPDEKKLEVEDKIFKILRKEIEKILYDNDEGAFNHRYKTEEISEVIRFCKRKNSLIYKYIKPHNN